MEETIGKRIMRHRKQLQLTQDQLAEKLGVTAQAVSKWENDQSCPDITMLPKLAEIFGISTDELLGHKQPEEKVHQAEIVEEPKKKHNNFEFTWNPGKSGSVAFAVYVISVGALYLAAWILNWNASFWDIAWPTGILCFGIHSLHKHISFFPLACILFGGYTLADKLFVLPFTADKKLIWALLILLFGVSLLFSAAKKSRKRGFFNVHKQTKGNGSLSSKDFTFDDNQFQFSGSFGSETVVVAMDYLQEGDIAISFGDYTIDLTQVAVVAPNCMIDANCAFGELCLLIPKQYQAVIDKSVSFAHLKTIGEPDPNTQGQIYLDCSVSFGEIVVKYV